MIYRYVVYLLVSKGLDIISTVLALEYGGVEFNPVWGWSMNLGGIFLVGFVSLFFVGLMVLIIEVFQYVFEFPESWYRTVYCVPVVLWVGFAVFNFRFLVV